MRTIDKKRYDRKQGLHPEALNTFPVACIEYIPLPLHVYACLSYAWAGVGGFWDKVFCNEFVRHDESLFLLLLSYLRVSLEWGIVKMEKKKEHQVSHCNHRLSLGRPQLTVSWLQYCLSFDQAAVPVLHMTYPSTVHKYQNTTATIMPVGNWTWEIPSAAGGAIAPPSSILTPQTRTTVPAI